MKNRYKLHEAILSHRKGSGLARPICFLAILMSFFIVSSTTAQTTITGKVTIEADGSPLVGANILEKGTTNGTNADVDGNYEIRVSGPGATLIFSYIGFTPQEIVVQDQSVINVTLEENTTELEGFVVVGYGLQSKKTVTGSIATVDASEMQNIPTAGTDQLLQGRAAGVQVSSDSGTPGGGVFVKIRGASSISGGSDPLYIVDGVPIETGSFGLGLGGATTSAIADLDPSDIENIQILKDASATSIYGARAANGVVIITTKRGSNSKPTVRFSSYYGVDRAINEPDLVTGPEYEMLRNEAAANNGQAQIYADPSSATDTDWASTVFRNGSVRNYDMDISGGNDIVRYAVSGSNFKQEGVLNPETFERNSGRINLDVDVSDKVKFGTSTTFSNSKRNRARNNDNITGVLGGVYFLPSNLPVYQPDGSYTKFSIFENPVAAANEIDFNMDVNRFIGNVFGEYVFKPGLNFKSSWSIDYTQVKEDQYDNTFTNNGSAVNGRATSYAAINSSWISENTLSYVFNVGENNFNTLVGTSIQETTFESTRADGEQFPSNDFTRITDAAVQTSSSSGTSNGIASFFGRVQYDYAGKYLASFSVRRDGSSKFGDENQWGTFPAASVGWVISEEEFFDVETVSNLKLKASYGLTGNQSGIGNFQAKGLWSGASYTDSPGTTPLQLGNPNLKWETTKQLDIGFELGLLDERLQITYDYYHKKTEDLLLAVPVPESTGYSELVQNFGELENKGMELAISADVIQKQDLNWNIQFNISGNRNKILKLAAPFNVYNRDIYRYEEGIPMYSFYFHEQTGVDPATGAPIFTDVDGNGTFDPNVDRKIVGNANPDFFGGIRSNLNYKNFDLSVFFQYSYGNEQLHWNRFFQEHGGTRNTNFLSTQLDRWQNPGDVTMVPKLTAANYAGNLRPSRFVEDGSYLRLKTLNLGYNIPKSFISKLGTGVSSVRIYMTGQNLLTFTNYSGTDPETTATASTSLTRGIEFYTVPQSKSIVGGINISF